MHKIFNLKIILYLELKSNYLDVTDNFFIFKKQVLIFFFYNSAKLGKKEYFLFSH